MGYSPPARKLAELPLRVMRVGSARIFVSPFSFRASINVVQVALAPANRKIQFTLSATVRGLPGQPIEGSLVTLLSSEMPKFWPPALI